MELDDNLQILQERRDLAFTLKDTKTIVGKLRTIVGTALHLIFIMFYLLIFAVSQLPTPSLHAPQSWHWLAFHLLVYSCCTCLFVLQIFVRRETLEHM